LVYHLISSVAILYVPEYNNSSHERFGMECNYWHSREQLYKSYEMKLFCLANS